MTPPPTWVYGPSSNVHPLVSLATRSFAWGARAAVFGFPVVQLFTDGPRRTAATGALMSIIGLRFALAARADSDARATPAPA